MFADKCVARDGHICDSVAEKVIDDYLSRKEIKHQRNISYPGGIYTADFKIGIKLIEYFSLSGELERYYELREIKKKLAKQYKLNLVEIYPKDLYPKNRLATILNL